MSDLLEFSPPGQVTFSLAGAKARFFDAGTTTPRTVYADEAETIAHPSPLTADSNGRFAQAFVSGGAVKVVVTQADDSTGYTLDPCTKVSATGSAAASISFTPSVAIPQTNVQTAIDAVQAEAAAGIAGAPAAVEAAFATDTVSLGALSRGAPVTKTADFAVAATENWLLNNKSGSACVVTLPAAASSTGREIMIQNLQAQAVNSASSNVIPLRGGSAASSILPAIIGAYAVLVSNGTNWQIVQQSSAISVGTAVAATSGTAIDFTGLPAALNRITIVFDNVSLSANASIIVQIGSGSFTTSGYGGGSYGTNNSGSTATTGFLIIIASAALAFAGSMTLTRVTGNTWVSDHTGLLVGTAVSVVGGGRVAIGGTLDRVRITTNGADTFDAGTVNVFWE